VNVFTTGGEQPTGMLKGLMVPLMTYFPLLSYGSHGGELDAFEAFGFDLGGAAGFSAPRRRAAIAW